jgi:hypothetical protein
VERLPAARLDEQALEIRLLLDHHDDLVADRSDTPRRLRWHLHDLSGDLGIPLGALDRSVWLERGPRARRPARESGAAAASSGWLWPLTAAKLIGEIAGADRFATDAQLPRTAGVAPVPASSGRSDRHRVDRGGLEALRCLKRCPPDGYSGCSLRIAPHQFLDSLKAVEASCSRDWRCA